MVHSPLTRVMAMNRRIPLALICAALIASTSVGRPLFAQAPAKSPPKKTMVHDFGLSSCELWLELRAGRKARGDARYLQAREWISGFITSYNWYKDPRGDVVAGVMERQRLYSWLDSYCRENPTKLVFSGVVDLIEYLRVQ